MKQTDASHRAGFTLIELLVVVAIIAVLAGLAFPTMSGVMRRVKETQALSMIHSLVSAAKSYQAEYNRLPKVMPDRGTGTIDDSIVYTEPENDLIAALLGKSQPFNPRGVQFLEGPMARDECNGTVVYENSYWRPGAGSRRVLSARGVQRLVGGIGDLAQMDDPVAREPDELELPPRHLAHFGREGFLIEHVQVGVQGRILAALTFGQDGVGVVPAEGGAQFQAQEPHRAGQILRLHRRSPGGGHACLKLPSEGRTLLGDHGEELLEIGDFHKLRRLAKSLLAVAADRDEVVQSLDGALAVHASDLFQVEHPLRGFAPALRLPASL
jgi:prepilin-type N-terminal cleavage/methylation domain-containing protein